jgi:hypothetical protein
MCEGDNMDIANKEEIDTFLFEHRVNGCIGVKGDMLDEEGLKLNIAWRDKVTNEEIEVKYDGI